MTCTDYERHEQLLDCHHQGGGTMVLVELADGCSGRPCQDCYTRLDIRHWPDLTDRIAGPADGLDALEVLRVLGRAGRLRPTRLYRQPPLPEDEATPGPCGLGGGGQGGAGG